MAVGVGFVELLMVLVSGSGLFSGGGIMGLPPGERDAALVKCAPADSLIYAEWSERSTGEAGAPGIDGLAADPEIRTFIKDVDRAILAMIERETEGGRQEERILGEALPPLFKSLLMRPGCLYANVDPDAAAKALEQGGPIASIAGLRVTLIVNGGDNADDMGKKIDLLIDLLASELPIEKTDNLQHQKIPLPLPGAELTIHRHKDYFIVGFGEGTIDAAVAGLSGNSKALTANDRYTAAMKRVEMKRTAGVTWIDVKGIVSKTSQAMGLQGAMIIGMAKMTGADAIDSVAVCTGVVDGQIRTKNYITTGGKTDGVLALAAGRAITPNDFSHIPGDADFVLAGSLNVPKVLTAAREIVGNADPQSKEVLDLTIQQLEAELGISFEDDVFKAFGDVWTIYDSPSGGGLFVSAPVLSLEVRDKEKANKVFARLMKVLGDALPGEQGNQFRRRGVFLEQKKFLDHTLFYVNTIGDDVPIAPTFCVTDKQLLVTLHPQTLKAHLRFLAAKEQSFAARIGKDLKLPEGELLSLTYFDAKKLVQFVYGVAPYLAQLAFSEMQREGFAIDISSLPSARALLPYIGTSLSVAVRTKDGILLESQSALPIPGGSVGFLSLPVSFMFLGVSRVPFVFGVQQLEQQAVPRAINVQRAEKKPVLLRRQLPVRKPAAVRRVRRLAP
ncbi:MAG: hypothetical protein HON53_18875 [Planctomycetaceae bacterium]|jgi:hypothetical protein|nr:hypothetical protein [Planctomycetaceae bacterium]MBT6153387.1 hypothetical protein [Planctomycetaceae bacterium]MBT6484036.1 hypothetical protein [Planctomycetaceae bacterium]MBT6496835.1 hypothetical protein [Planctomycetaceae bacterium]